MEHESKQKDWGEFADCGVRSGDRAAIPQSTQMISIAKRPGKSPSDPLEKARIAAAAIARIEFEFSQRLFGNLIQPFKTQCSPIIRCRWLVGNIPT